MGRNFYNRSPDNRRISTFCISSCYNRGGLPVSYVCIFIKGGDNRAGGAAVQGGASKGGSRHRQVHYQAPQQSPAEGHIQVSQTVK